jgi:hypothetical protein
VSSCPHCGQPLVACVHAQDKMQVRHWYCMACKYDTRAIGRERMLTVDDPVQASIEAFVEMRIEGNG